MRLGKCLFFCFLAWTVPVAQAEEPILKIQKVTTDVYALVGPLSGRDARNLGNNATFGVIVTKAGVVLIDSGGSYKGAKQIDDAIKRVSKKPVIMVINSGGQDHRWFGNDYFKRKGAKIIAARAAVADQKARLNNQLTILESQVGKQGLVGTRDVYADRVFDQSLKLNVGGVQLYIHNPGTAHTPGDSYVWLPQKKVVFAGDIVVTERLLSVNPVSKSKAWISAFDAVAALKPRYVVPGHGHATTMAKARKDTRDYLVMLRSEVARMIKKGIGIERSGQIDQSRFRTLKNYKQLKGRNAQQVFSEMEWE